ncbi:MAG: UbiA prenyltransferase family protein [Deltaproteobacteria bacterium]|nr:UbiA prenyltransferase family protein [Deltaproteobacteria bacterium]
MSEPPQPPAPSSSSRPTEASRPSLAGHLAILRLDHWVKNVFVLPGIVVALTLAPQAAGNQLWLAIAVGLLATCLVASSNYTLNEVLDAPFDRLHPTKRHRPVPSGQVHIPLAYLQWIVFGAAGIALGASVSPGLAWTLGALWLMGVVYNVRPIRTKEVAYLDALSEAVNNPLRMLAGWYIATPLGAPPGSLLLSYWMVGAYFMAIKRYAELRQLGSTAQTTGYRRSFGVYTLDKLLISVMFYSSAAMLFLGAFIMRYRLELILSFPFVALVMALYLSVAFKNNSAAQAPERLYKEPHLMFAILGCAAVILLLLYFDIPWVHRLLEPTVPGM